MFPNIKNPRPTKIDFGLKILFGFTFLSACQVMLDFQPNLLIITTLPGLEQGGLTSTVTGGGVMEALGTTATGALGNPLI